MEGTTARARVTVTAGELATLRLSPERVVVQAGTRCRYKPAAMTRREPCSHRADLASHR